MDGTARSEDEFHETLEDITSASSSDAEEGARRFMGPRVAPVASHERPPVWTPSSFHSKFSVWKDDPSSVNDRRQRFFKNWGIKNLREEPSVGSASPLVSKNLVAAKTGEASDGVDNEIPPCRICGQHRKSKGDLTRPCNHLEGSRGNLIAKLGKRVDSNRAENGSKDVTEFGQLDQTGNTRLEEISGAVLRDGKSKAGPVLSRLGPLSHGRFRSAGTSPDVSPYQEGTNKVLASPEGSLSPLWTPEAGNLHRASSSQEKLSQSFDTDNGYETRSQDGYSAAEDFGMDETELKIRDLDSGKEFLMDRFNTDGSLNMLREVDTGRELTLAEFEKVVGLSPITQEMKRRQRAAESGFANEKSGLGKTSSKKKNGWLKYFVVKKPKEKPVSGGSVRSEKHSQSGEDTDGSSRGGRLSRDGSTKGVHSREGSFAGPDREDSTKGGNPADDSTPGSFWRQSKKVKVKLRRKSIKELSDLHIGQEIQAHQGAIWTMKFSPDGRYLASAGQDRVVRVWEVLDHPSFSESDFSGGQFENGNSANGLYPQGDDGFAKDGNVRSSQHGISKADKEGCTKGSRDGSTEADKDGSTRGAKEGSARGAKEGSTRGGKGLSQSRKSSHLGSKGPLPKLFWLSEKPVRSFYGHTGDVLDLAWSQTKTSISDKLLLSSSMDKTVRLWHISEEECLRVFSHNDYVTCVQFNPVDDSYFLSGALDDKLRIWNIAEHQVVDWIDLREMITAVSYTPDGEKAIVGSYKGTCRFYNTIGNKLQLDASIDVRTENKKGRGKKITGLHCMPGDPEKVLVTSNDSRIRVYDHLKLCAKYKGLKNINSQISASYTRNGDYIVSASEDSRVLIWSSDNKDPSSTKSLYRRDKQLACEEFHCRFVSVALPWPEPTTDSSVLQADSGAATGSDRMDSARAATEPDDAGGFQSDDDDDDKFEPSYDFLSSGRRDQVVEDEEEALLENVSLDVMNSGDGGDSSPRLQSCTSFFTDSGPKGSSTWPEEQLPAFGSPLAGLMRSASLGSDDGRQGVVVEEELTCREGDKLGCFISPLMRLFVYFAIPDPVNGDALDEFNNFSYAQPRFSEKSSLVRLLNEPLCSGTALLGIWALKREEVCFLLFQLKDMSQLGTELIPHGVADKGIQITLMYSKSSQQILFVEAGKDFVDLVVGFLTLPIGCVIKLLSENAMVTPKTVGGIANVFKSIQRLEAEETLCASKKMLTELKPVYRLGYLATESELGDLEPCHSQGYFTCGASAHCTFVSPRYGAKCPRHHKKMTTQCKMMDDGSDTPTGGTPNGDTNGYVKSSSKYFVTDNLEVFPSSNSLALLKKLKVENMSSLDSIELRVGTDEVLKLLRASLTSGNVLSDVFSKPLRETIAVESSPGLEIFPLESPNQAGEPVVPLKESIEIARDWGRGLYNALREVQDAAFHSSLVNYVREREQRISSALRDLNNSPATQDPNAVPSMVSSSRSSSCETKRIRKRADGEYIMPAPCKEMLMLEKQVDKMMARLCHLTSEHSEHSEHSELESSPVDPVRPKSAAAAAAVKPPWTMLTNSRVRLPSRVWHP